MNLSFRERRLIIGCALAIAAIAVVDIVALPRPQIASVSLVPAENFAESSMVAATGARLPERRRRSAAREVREPAAEAQQKGDDGLGLPDVPRPLPLPFDYVPEMVNEPTGNAHTQHLAAPNPRSAARAAADDRTILFASSSVNISTPAPRRSEAESSPAEP